MTDKITPDEVSELVDRYKQWNIGSDKDGQVLPNTQSIRPKGIGMDTSTRRFRRTALLGATVLISGLTLVPSAWASDAAQQALVAPLCFGAPSTGAPGGGPDVIIGTNGPDNLLRGFQGNDRICGRRGNDRLIGDAGNDKLNGGPGYDRCDGGAGVDTAVNCEVVSNVP